MSRREPSPGPIGAVIVGVDGSPGAEQALHWALAEAEMRKARLRVVHAWMFNPAA